MARLVWCLIVAATGTCASPVLGQDQENPFKKAKVGDWVRYAKTVTYKGKVDYESVVKLTVTAVADQEVTVEFAETVNGDKKVKTVQIDFTDRYHPTRLLFDYDLKGKVEGTGKEKIKVGDKTYECASVTLAFERVKGYPGTIKLWTAADVPIEGIVKAESAFAGAGEQKWVLEASGRK
jgi:hypothetical protein